MENYFMPIVIGFVIMISPMIVFGLDHAIKPTHSWVRAVIFVILCGACSAGLVAGAYIAHNALM